MKKKKKNVCFQDQSDIFLNDNARLLLSNRKNKGQIKNRSALKLKKIRTASLKQNLLVLIKKNTFLRLLLQRHYLNVGYIFDVGIYSSIC